MYRLRRCISCGLVLYLFMIFGQMNEVLMLGASMPFSPFCMFISAAPNLVTFIQFTDKETMLEAVLRSMTPPELQYRDWSLCIFMPQVILFMCFLIRFLNDLFVLAGSL